MPLVLAAATPLELESALAGPGWDISVPRRGAVRAKAAGRELMLLVTGVGPVNAALEMGAVLAGHDVSGAVNLGIAGSFDLELAPLGAAVAAGKEILPEYGVAGPDGLAGVSSFAFPQWQGKEGTVLREIGLDPRKATLDMGLLLDEAMATGAFLTVAGVTGCARRAAALSGRFSPLAENMEGFALALACLTRGVPFLEIRTVSNAVGERDLAKWDLTRALMGLGDVLAGLFSGPRQTGSYPSPIS